MRIRKTCLFLFCLLLAVAPPATFANPGGGGNSEDDGDADPDELFKPFETGLLFKRRMYLEGDIITFVPYYPTGYNDTRDTRQWKIYVSHWEQDSPSFVNVYVYDDSPHNYNSGKTTVDLLLTINHYDNNKNLVEASRRYLTDVSVEKGLTKIPFNIHNYKGDIVQVKLLNVVQKFSTKPLDVVE